MRFSLEEIRRRVKRFGCDKPGGRPLSEAAAAKLGQGAVCVVERKSDKKKLMYKKPGVAADVRKEKLKGKEANLTKKLETAKKGSKRESLYTERLKRVREKIQGKVREIKQKRDEIFRRVDEIDPKQIKVDPGRFQYKIMGAQTKTGEVGSLEGVERFDPNLAGILQVWKDPADGATYVVNGHNRLALAQRAGAEKIAVRYLEVGTAKEARSVGALTNIAEGRGNSMDAAKFFRDTGLGQKDLQAQGIRLKDKIAADGIALASLPRVLFDKVVDEELESEIGAALGRTGFEEQKQYRLYELIHKQESKGRKVTPDLISELASLVKASATEKKTGEDLFGETEEEEDV